MQIRATGLEAGDEPVTKLFPTSWLKLSGNPENRNWLFQPTKAAMSDGKSPWVIFDADNTVWAVEHLYDAARQNMCNYLSSKGIESSQAEKYQRERDQKLHISYGYSACRFARSFEDTLLHFFSEAQPEEICHVRRLALDVFEQQALPMEGLEHVLGRISSTYQMGIITAGERWVQERRLAHFHLQDRFAAIEIVESKSEAVFRFFAGNCGIDPAVSWVVGDSYRSDILPAKAAGFRAILLKTPNWVEVESQPGLVHPDVVIQSLKELPKELGLT